MSEGTRGPNPPAQVPPPGGPETDRPRDTDVTGPRPNPLRSGPAKSGRPQSGTNGAGNSTAVPNRSGVWQRSAKQPSNDQQAASRQPYPNGVAQTQANPEATTTQRSGETKESRRQRRLNGRGQGSSEGWSADGQPPQTAVAVGAPGAERDTDTAVIPAVPGDVAVPRSTTAPVVAAASAPSVGPPGSATKHKAGAARRTRKARLRLSRLDPWSVMKTSFLFSIAAGIMLVVAVYVVWTVIGASSLFDSVNDIVKSVVSTPGDTTPFRIQEYINTQKVMGVTALLACFDVVIVTALATLGSFLYNLAATMLGGLEITLAED